MALKTLRQSRIPNTLAKRKENFKFNVINGKFPIIILTLKQLQLFC